MAKVQPGYNGSDLKSKVKNGPKPPKSAPQVSGFKGAVGGPSNGGVRGGKGK